jgi:hypothetical protein
MINGGLTRVLQDCRDSAGMSMRRAADALVIGFCKAAAVTQASFAPLCRLRQEGHLRDIHYVTWDDPALDNFVAPVAAMEGVRITRLPQPAITGSAGWRGVRLQVENLRCGLALLAPETLVLKLRPDFVVRADLLREKLNGFDRHCAPVARTAANGTVMPAPLLKCKMWLAWADANQPFFYEDAAFLALKEDAEKLVTAVTEEDRAILDNGPLSGPFAHVVRYGRIFAGRYPLFAAYLARYRFFANDMAYRRELLAAMLGDGFFWHMVIAHAWILHSQFHIDAGTQGDIQFYANNRNEGADWSDLARLRTANPYDDIAMWRDGTHPGEASHSPSRTYGRLVDDGWQEALFTRPLPDLPAATLKNLMENVAGHGDGRLAEIERQFYSHLERIHRTRSPLARAS